MAVTLTKPTIGSISWGESVNQNFQDIEAALGGGALPTRHISGLVIRYASTTSISVSAGKARNKADTADMTWTPADVAASTVSLASVGALGVERKALSGTASFTNLSTTVVGSGTSFFTEFGGRAATGTITASSGTTITGTGTSFLTEVAVNDLVGNSTGGYSRVSLISSDTSLQVDDAVTLSGAWGVIECPRIETAGGRVYMVGRIASNTSLTLVASTFALATESGVATYSTAKRCSTATPVDGWRAVWLLSGGSGTTVVLSTQRTTPYLSTSGYTTSYRRIGWVRVDASGNLALISGQDGGHWRFFGTSHNVMILNANASTTPTTVSLEAAAPPTTTLLQATAQLEAPNTVTTAVVGHPTVSTSALVVYAPSTSAGAYTVGPVSCDEAQRVAYSGVPSSSGDGFYLYVDGYWDALE